jgi:hypothetical protein
MRVPAVIAVCVAAALAAVGSAELLVGVVHYQMQDNFAQRQVCVAFPLALLDNSRLNSGHGFLNGSSPLPVPAAPSSLLPPCILLPQHCLRVRCLLSCTVCAGDCPSTNGTAAPTPLC